MMKLLKNAKRRLTSKRGISMVEAIVAMAIIGTITLSALAVFANYNTVYDVNYDLFYARILADDALASFQYAENNTEFKQALGMVAQNGEGTGVDVESVGDSDVAGKLGDDRDKLSLIVVDAERNLYVYNEAEDELNVRFDGDSFEESIEWLKENSSAELEDNKLYLSQENHRLTYNAPRYSTFTTRAMISLKKNGLIVGVKTENVVQGVFQIWEDNTIVYTEPGLQFVYFDNCFWKDTGSEYVKMKLAVTDYGNGNIYDYLWIEYDWKEAPKDEPGNTMPRSKGVSYASADKAKEEMEKLITKLTTGYSTFSPFLDETQKQLTDHKPSGFGTTFRFKTLAKIFESIKLSVTSNSFYYDFVADSSNTFAGYVIEPNEGEGAEGGSKYVVNEYGEKIFLVCTYEDNIAMNKAIADMNKGAEFSEKGQIETESESITYWNKYDFSGFEYKLESATTRNGVIDTMTTTAGKELTRSSAEIQNVIASFPGVSDVDILKNELGGTETGTIYEYSAQLHHICRQQTYNSKKKAYEDRTGSSSKKYKEYTTDITIIADDTNKTIYFWVDALPAVYYYNGDKVDTYGEYSQPCWYYLSHENVWAVITFNSWSWKTVASKDEIVPITGKEALGRDAYTISKSDLLDDKKQTAPKSPKDGEDYTSNPSLTTTVKSHTLANKKSFKIGGYDCVIDYENHTITENHGTPQVKSDIELEEKLQECFDQGYTVQSVAYYYTIERLLGQVLTNDSTRTISFIDQKGIKICEFTYAEEQQQEYIADANQLDERLKNYIRTENPDGVSYAPNDITVVRLEANSSEEKYTVSVIDVYHLDELENNVILFMKEYGSEEEYLNAFESMGFMTEEVEGKFVTYTCLVNEYSLTISINYSTNYFEATIDNGNGEVVYRLKYHKG